MAVKIKFDNARNPEIPTFVLATRSGKKLGIISNITDVHVNDNLNSPMDISFKTHKEVDSNPYGVTLDAHGYFVVAPDDDDAGGDRTYYRLKLNNSDYLYVQRYDEVNNGRTSSQIWDEISNFRKVWIKEWDKWFTLTLSIDEADETIKNISLVPNTEFELSNTNVHDLEINTESDILREDYVEPTIFYNKDKPEASLLHRVLSFTKGVTIKYVDPSLEKIQRTFSLDGSNVYDTFQTIAQEIQCLFVFDSGTTSKGKIERSVSAYELLSYCNKCGYRGNIESTCPKCGSADIQAPYGEDTTILVDNEALASSITLTTDTDSVKNCFRLLSGDGLMDAAIIATNPNGSQYIWYFNDDVTKDMSAELREKLSKYDEDYMYYEEEYSIPISSSLLTYYNSLIDKYKSMRSDLVKVEDVNGYAELMNTIYDVLDFQLYLENSMMPTVQTDTSAKEQAGRLTVANMSPVAAQNVTTMSITTVENAVLSMAKAIIDKRYTVKIHSSSYEKATFTWRGNFDVTANNDDLDTAISSLIAVVMSSDYSEFCKQKIEKAISSAAVEDYSISSLFKLDQDDFVLRLKQFSRAGLDSFYSAANAAIGVLVELGISNPSKATLIEGGLEAYYDIYQPLSRKLWAIEAEIKTRDEEIEAIEELYDSLMAEKHRINNLLDIVEYLGEDLATEMYSYKMEDDYENSNYISEGLDNAELFKMAAEFVEVANNEIHRAAEQHHSISTTLNNLLTIEEFSPLVEYFSVGNWIRVKIDGKLYKVKLLSYTIDYDNLDTLQVEFSDAVGVADTSISDIFAQAKSMAKSYDSIKYQIANGTSSKRTLNDWVKKGLDLTTMKILGATNQTQIWDETGISLKQWDDIIQDYTDYQSKWINTTLAFTTDNWETTETALGRFIFYNPKTNDYEEGYGVIAKQLIGNLILGEEVGIYNDTGSVSITEGGITITANGDDLVNNTEFLIQKQYTDASGETQYIKQMYIDEDGTLVFNGSSITFQSGKTLEQRISEAENTAKEAKTLNVMLTNEVQIVPTDSDGNNGNFADCYTSIVVMYGSSDVTSSAKINVTPSSGVIGSWNATTKVYTVTNMTTDIGTVDFVVTYDSLSTTKSMSITKVKAGKTIDGAAGRGIESTEIKYQKSTSGTTVPTGTWQNNPPQLSSGEYLWTRTYITYTDSTSSTSYSVGYAGSNGSSVTVSDVTNYYAETKTSKQPADSEWKTTIPNVAQGNYLWTKTVTTYSDGKSTSIYTYSRQSIDGQNGEDGLPGKSSYFHIKYSPVAQPNDSQMTEDPNVYIGICVDNNVADPDTASSYTWSKFEGSDGKNGTPGGDGYVHFAYSTSSDGSSNFSVTTFSGATYIGVYSDHTQADSTDYRDYEWSLIKGDRGEAALAYDLSLNTSTIIRTLVGAYAPNYISASAQQRSGQSAAVAYNGYFKVEYSTNNSSWTQLYVGSGMNVYISLTSTNLPSTAKSVRCTLYESASATSILDQQTIPIIDEPKSGNPGYSQTTIHLYMRSKDAPSAPSTNITYKFSDDSITGNIGSWIREVPSGSNPCWITVASASSSGATDVITPSEWSTPIVFVENGKEGEKGKDGIDGYNQATIYLYQRKATAPSKPSGSVTYTFSTGTLSSIPSGWNTSIPTTTGDPCWITSVAVISKEASASITSSSWSDVTKLVEDGADSYTVVLSNESHSFSGDSQKAIATSITCNIYGYIGATLSSCTIGTITGAPTGMTTSISNNGKTNASFKVNVTTALTTRQGELTIPVTIGGKTINKKFSWTLVLNGNDGEPTRSYFLEANSIVMKKSYRGEITPNTVTFSAYYRDGDAATRTAYSGRFVVQETTNGNTWTTISSSSPSSNVTSVTHTPASSAVIGIRCYLYAAGGLTNQLDIQSVAIVSDTDGIVIGSRNLIRLSNTLDSDNYFFFNGLLVTNDNIYITTNDGKHIMIANNS